MTEPTSTGVVVWLTGLPSSGKSTLAERALEALQASATPACVLDGDAVRAALVPEPGYDPRGRGDFYETLARLAALLARQGLVVLVPATANRAEFRRRARELAPRFLLVWLDVPADECAERDAKGLYAKARAGEARDLPGADARYDRPETPDVVARGGKDPDAVDAILHALGVDGSTKR